MAQPVLGAGGPTSASATPPALQAPKPCASSYPAAAGGEGAVNDSDGDVKGDDEEAMRGEDDDEQTLGSTTGVEHCASAAATQTTVRCHRDHHDPNCDTL